MIKARSKRLKASEDIGYVATRKGDAIRVDQYVGRSKNRNIAFFLEVTEWPKHPADQYWFANDLLIRPTLLAGPSLEGAPGIAPSPDVDAVMKAVNEVIDVEDTDG